MTLLRLSQWFLRRMGELRPAQILLLARAFAWMVAARIALRVIPVRWIITWKQRPVRGGAQPDAEAAIREVAWAIAVVARRSPVRFVCFPQSLAAHALLAARGVETRLHYGVTRREKGLEAHAWLEAGGQIVTGAEEAEAFHRLETY